MSLKICNVDIGCGIRQISGFTYYGGVVTPENGLKQLLGCLYVDCNHPQPVDKLLRLNAGMFLISDRHGGMGNKVMELVQQTWPHHQITKQSSYNPHSHNTFHVYAWVPKIEDLIAHPLWPSAKTWARSLGTDKIWGRNVAGGDNSWKPQPLPAEPGSATDWPALV